MDRFSTGSISTRLSRNACFAAIKLASSGFFPLPGRTQDIHYLASIAIRPAERVYMHDWASVDAPAGEAAFASTSVAITHIPDPTPAVRAIKKRLVKYKRADGLDLSFTLYTPPGYQEGTRVPTILYAYPLDYAEASTAGHVTGSQETFTRLREYRLLLLAGYAIIDDDSFPIIGDPKRPTTPLSNSLWLTPRPPSMRLCAWALPIRPHRSHRTQPRRFNDREFCGPFRFVPRRCGDERLL